MALNPKKSSSKTYWRGSRVNHPKKGSSYKRVPKKQETAPRPDKSRETSKNRVKATTERQRSQPKFWSRKPTARKKSSWIDKKKHLLKTKKSSKHKPGKQRYRKVELNIPEQALKSKIKLVLNIDGLELRESTGHSRSSRATDMLRQSGETAEEGAEAQEGTNLFESQVGFDRGLEKTTEVKKSFGRYMASGRVFEGDRVSELGSKLTETPGGRAGPPLTVDFSSDGSGAKLKTLERKKRFEGLRLQESGHQSAFLRKAQQEVTPFNPLEDPDGSKQDRTGGFRLPLVASLDLSLSSKKSKNDQKSKHESPRPPQRQQAENIEYARTEERQTKNTELLSIITENGAENSVATAKTKLLDSKELSLKELHGSYQQMIQDLQKKYEEEISRVKGFVQEQDALLKEKYRKKLDLSTQKFEKAKRDNAKLRKENDSLRLRLKEMALQHKRDIEEMISTYSKKSVGGVGVASARPEVAGSSRRGAPSKDLSINTSSKDDSSGYFFDSKRSSTRTNRGNNRVNRRQRGAQRAPEKPSTSSIAVSNRSKKSAKNDSFSNFQLQNRSKNSSMSRGKNSHRSSMDSSYSRFKISQSLKNTKKSLGQLFSGVKNKTLRRETRGMKRGTQQTHQQSYLRTKLTDRFDRSGSKSRTSRLKGARGGLSGMVSGRSESMNTAERVNFLDRSSGKKKNRKNLESEILNENEVDRHSEGVYCRIVCPACDTGFDVSREDLKKLLNQKIEKTEFEGNEDTEEGVLNVPIPKLKLAPQKSNAGAYFEMNLKKNDKMTKIHSLGNSEHKKHHKHTHSSKKNPDATLKHPRSPTYYRLIPEKSYQQYLLSNTKTSQKKGKPKRLHLQTTRPVIIEGKKSTTNPPNTSSKSTSTRDQKTPKTPQNTQKGSLRSLRAIGGSMLDRSSLNFVQGNNTNNNTTIQRSTVTNRTLQSSRESKAAQHGFMDHNTSDDLDSDSALFRDNEGGGDRLIYTTDKKIGRQFFVAGDGSQTDDFEDCEGLGEDKEDEITIASSKKFRVADFCRNPYFLSDSAGKKVSGDGDGFGGLRAFAGGFGVPGNAIGIENCASGDDGKVSGGGKGRLMLRSTKLKNQLLETDEGNGGDGGVLEEGLKTPEVDKNQLGAQNLENRESGDLKDRFKREPILVDSVELGQPLIPLIQDETPNKLEKKEKPRNSKFQNQVDFDPKEGPEDHRELEIGAKNDQEGLLNQLIESSEQKNLKNSSFSAKQKYVFLKEVEPQIKKRSGSEDGPYTSYPKSGQFNQKFNASLSEYFAGVETVNQSSEAHTSTLQRQSEPRNQSFSSLNPQNRQKSQNLGGDSFDQNRPKNNPNASFDEIIARRMNKYVTQLEDFCSNFKKYRKHDFDLFGKIAKKELDYTLTEFRGLTGHDPEMVNMEHHVVHVDIDASEYTYWNNEWYFKYCGQGLWGSELSQKSSKIGLKTPKLDSNAETPLQASNPEASDLEASGSNSSSERKKRELEYRIQQTGRRKFMKNTKDRILKGLGTRKLFDDKMELRLPVMASIEKDGVKINIHRTDIFSAVYPEAQNLESQKSIKSGEKMQEIVYFFVEDLQQTLSRDEVLQEREILEKTLREKLPKDQHVNPNFGHFLLIFD